MIKVILVDDHKIFLDGLQAILKEEEGIKVVGEALNSEEIFDLLKLFDVDILVLDIEMPGASGIEIAAKVREKHPGVKILMLTMHDKKEFIDQLIPLRIEGYILKNKGSEQLVDALSAISKGKTYFSQEVMTVAMRSGKVKKGEENITLSKREFEVLRLIAEGNTSKQIAGKLHIAPSTVETYRRNLIGKLKVKGTPGLIKWAVQKGIC